MISSLLSSFEFSPRRALFLSAHKAAAYHWQGGDLASSYLFDANDEGRSYFARYLNETPNIPTYVLVDLFEEEFRRDTIPHVFGPDRDAIVGRKKARLFRDTPYFHAFVQGRETEGRRDDRVLMTAITNPNLLSPWLALMQEHKAPLASICSVPLFTSQILKLLPEQKGNVLMVSMQSVSGLRQTFLQNGEFRVSRLVQMPRYGTEPYGPHIRQEVEKIRRYLNSLRLSSVDDPVDVYILVAGELFEELRDTYKDSGFNHYHVLDINDLLEKSGSRRRVSTPFSDQLFVHRVLKDRPCNLYASTTDRRHYLMRRARQFMYAAAALLLIGGSIWSGLNFMEGLTFRQRSVAAQKMTQFYETRYQMAKERLPQTAVEPGDIETAVALADTLKSYKSTPLEMLRAVGTTMQKLPAVQVDSIQWATSTRPDVDPDRQTAAPVRTATRNAPQLTSAAQAPAYRFYQIATLQGRLDPFDGNFRSAIATINEFAESLRMTPGVHEVQIVSLPLDISSTASLQGGIQAQRREANFTMKVVLGIADES
jgi:hypothetical protein